MTQLQTITLGGGCFWCTDAVFVGVRGIVDVESGYSNGQVTRPTYEEVCSGRTGCNEVVKLEFDPAQILLGQILEILTTIPGQTHMILQAEKEKSSISISQRPRIARANSTAKQSKG